jgi:predicted ATPase
MGNHLEHISVAGFKSIASMDLALGSLNILIGANGSGKSNFLAVFALLHDIIEQRLQIHVAERGGANALLHFGQKRTSEIRIRLSFGPNAYEVALAPAAGDTLFFTREVCWHHAPRHLQPLLDRLGEGHRESRLPEAANRHPGRDETVKARGLRPRRQRAPGQSSGLAASLILADLQSWEIYHFHDTSKSARIKQKHAIDDNEALRPDAANLAAFLYRLQQTDGDAYRRIVAAVRLVAPFFDDFVLQPDRLRTDMIQLEWRERGSDDYFHAHALSDGTLRFICLATLLLQPELPTAILIDEPELGLHPAAIQHLAAMVKSAATKTQVILSTQSVTLVNQFAPEDVIVVDREDQTSTFRRISPDEIKDWLDDYVLGELWERTSSVASMKRCLILVEGRTEEVFVKSCLAAHLKSHSLAPTPKIITTKQVKNGPNFKGGIHGYAQVKDDLRRLLGDSGAAGITTVIDYYALPADFPGMNNRPRGAPRARARCPHFDEWLSWLEGL